MWPTPEATALAVQRHREAAMRRPNRDSIPTGPWPKYKPVSKPEPKTYYRFSAQEALALLRENPQGLTATEIGEALKGDSSRVSGLLLRHVEVGRVLRVGAKPIRYRMA